MSQVNTLRIRSIFFLIFASAIFLLFFNVISPFISIIVIALILVQIFHPIYVWIKSKAISDGVAAITTTLISITLIIIPIILSLLLATSEIANIAEQFGTNNAIQNSVLGTTSEPDILNTLELNINSMLNGFQDSLNSLGFDSDAIFGGELEINVRAIIRELVSAIQIQIIPIASSILSGSLNLVFQLFILIVTLIYLFIEYKNLPKIVSRFSPLEDEIDTMLWEKFTNTTRAVIIGSFFVAIAQATSVIIPMMILGVGAPVLLWILMIIFSLIPVGSGVIWGPVGIALILSGSPVAGIFLLIYGAIIINIIETTLRPRLLRNSTHLHPLILIFTALGGINYFGVLGIIYGPVIAVFLISVIEIYNLKFK